MALVCKIQHRLLGLRHSETRRHYQSTSKAQAPVQQNLIVWGPCEETYVGVKLAPGSSQAKLLCEACEGLSKLAIQHKAQLLLAKEVQVVLHIKTYLNHQPDISCMSRHLLVCHSLDTFKCRSLNCCTALN